MAITEHLTTERLQIRLSGLVYAYYSLLTYFWTTVLLIGRAENPPSRDSLFPACPMYLLKYREPSSLFVMVEVVGLCLVEVVGHCVVEVSDGKKTEGEDRLAGTVCTVQCSTRVPQARRGGVEPVQLSKGWRLRVWGADQ